MQARIFDSRNKKPDGTMKTYTKGTKLIENLFKRKHAAELEEQDKKERELENAARDKIAGKEAFKGELTDYPQNNNSTSSIFPNENMGENEDYPHKI